jgi:hypothetical protein
VVLYEILIVLEILICQINTAKQEYLNHLRTIESFINLDGEKGQTKWQQID